MVLQPDFVCPLVAQPDQLIDEFDANGVSKEVLQELPVHGNCSSALDKFYGTTDATPFGRKYGILATFVVANVIIAKSTNAMLSNVTLVAHYSSSEMSGTEWQTFV